MSSEYRTLLLTQAERHYLLYVIGPDTLWPASEAHLPLLRQVPGGHVAGGPDFRALLVALAIRGGEGEIPIELSPSDLWLLDGVLLSRDLRREKLPDGRPALELAQKIWDLILDVYDDRLPPPLRKEHHHAGTDDHPDEDPSAIIASAEAFLRSRDHSGTGDDLSSAEA